MLFFNVPPESNQFADLDLNGAPETYVPPPFENSSDSPLVDVQSLERLRQLTTEPVIGYQQVQVDASSTPMVYYIKPGTGHIYSIDLTSGEETRKSGTTIPSARKGVVTPDGQYALIQYGYGLGAEFVVGHLSTTSDEMSTQNIPGTIVSFAVTTDNKFLYATKEVNQLVAKQYFPTSNTSEILFTVPFAEAIIDWGGTAVDSHYIYPKANSSLEGYLYEAKQGELNRLPVDGYGLTALGSNDDVMYGTQLNGTYITQMFNRPSSTKTTFGQLLLPEKCLWFNVRNSFVCADSTTSLKSDTPNTWYEGTVSYVDNFWEIKPQATSSNLLIDTKEESGRELDIINLITDSEEENIYFQNKNDQTLWLYQINQPE
jgi:hypothetical protein